MKSNKIEPSAILTGILVLLFLSIFLYGIEWGIFMRKVTGARMALGINNFFEAGAEVMKDEGFLAYGFLFIFIKYAIASYVVARSVRQAVMRHVMIFATVGIVILNVLVYLQNSKAILDRPVLYLMQVLWAFLVCFAVAGIVHLKQKPA